MATAQIAAIDPTNLRDSAYRSLHDAFTRGAFAPGDMQFINNHVIYHARTAYEDREGTGDQRRLLHRLWLSMPNSRALPADHATLWTNVEAGTRRGGIGQG